MGDTIWGIFYGDMLIRDLSEARERIDPKWRGYTQMMIGMWEKSGLINDGENTTSEDMQKGMIRYHEEVQANVPADRLLVWSVSDGWEPLCEFLELPVPDQPLPPPQRQQGVCRAGHRRLAARAPGVACAGGRSGRRQLSRSGDSPEIERPPREAAALRSRSM